MLVLLAVSVLSVQLTSHRARSRVSMAAKTAPYGGWESPISAEFITESGVGLGGVSVGPVSGDLYWLERRPKEGGRSVLCRRAPGDKAASERGAIDITPPGSNVRTRVHEYGGKSHILGRDAAGGEFAVYANFADQRLYKLPIVGGAGGEPVELTPASAYAEDARYRFADFDLDEARQRLICVREDHTRPEPANVKNEVVALALDGSGAVEVLASGADFYAAPRLSPDGRTLAFVSWDHPSMPWDVTRLSTLALDAERGLPAAGAKPTVVAGADGQSSVLQPAWSPATGELFFVSDHENGYWNLFCLDTAQGGQPANVAPMLADFSGAAPGWALGQQGYSFAKGTGAVLAAVRLPGEAASTLLVLGAQAPHAKTAQFSAADGGLPYGFGGLSTSADGSKLYMLGASPELPGGLYEWAGLSSAAAPAPACLLASSMKASAVIDPKYIATPRLLTFPTTDEARTGVTSAYGYYYPPTNGDFAPPAGELPPLLVKAHGGPTACTSSSFNPGIQFWCARAVQCVRARCVR